jgi:hypothetical protein
MHESSRETTTGEDTDDTHDEETAVESLTATPTWSDASLRMYLEDDNDIRDLLVVVHDNSGVEPAGPDHPFMKSLFREEKVKLADMTSVCRHLSPYLDA